MEPETPLREPSVEEDAVAADDDEAGARMEPQPTLLLFLIHPPGLLHGVLSYTFLHAAARVSYAGSAVRRGDGVC